MRSQAVGVLSLALLLSACPPPRVEFGRDGAPTSIDDLLSRVDFAQKQVVAIKGDAKVKISSPRRGAAFDLFAAASLPGSLHLEALDFFGRPQAMLLSDGAGFGAWDMANGRYFVGRATPQNLARLLPIAMSPQELVATLLGRPYRLETQQRAFTLDAARGLFVITLTQGEVQQVLEVQPPSYRVVRVRWNGPERYALDFEELAPLGSFTFAKLLRVSAPAANESVELRYGNISLNQAPEEALFDLTPPPNVAVENVDGAAAAPGSLSPQGAPR